MRLRSHAGRSRRGGARSRATAATAAALALGLAAVAGAGELDVTPAAAAGGAFGLDASPGIGCATANNEVGPGDVAGNRTACDKITNADPSRVVNPGANFLAGTQIRFTDRFVVDADAPFSARVNAFINSPFAFLTDDSPSNETNYWAFYRVNLDDLDLALGDDIGQIVGYNAAGQPQFRLVMRRNAAPAENRIAIQARDDTAGMLVEHGEELPLGAGFNVIAVWWRSGPGRGQFLASVNGTPLGGLDGLDNDTGRIDRVRLGIVDGNPDLTSGSYYLDDFASFRTLAP